jgi:hypothetical protein
MPVIINPLSAYSLTALKHYVTAVDWTLYNGQKCLIVEDSAWFGGLNRRIITEDWVKNRVVTAAYPMNFKFGPVSTAPSYDGVTIISAQKCLQADGDFPLNVSFAENVGPTTRASLLKFQVKYNLPQTGAIDVATQSKLHQMFP